MLPTSVYLSSAAISVGLSGTGGVGPAVGEGMLDIVLIDSDAVSVLKGVYINLLKLRDFIAWEAAMAMAAIEADSSIEKPQSGVEKEADSSN
ncbi:hypothetical protein PR202_gb21512 [Eleusine coracana subsp. coracana]|uniref:Uncharacterized protein n=1 Tax=Eleusine coracana subsp. coracana TaxID=191504 RepID=A0AAV5FE50_ELECO|nr:hypothetical protein PR202_gb21512 [Eleusine coracana subsp. coracana]